MVLKFEDGLRVERYLFGNVRAMSLMASLKMEGNVLNCRDYCINVRTTKIVVIAIEFCCTHVYLFNYNSTEGFQYHRACLLLSI